MSELDLGSADDWALLKPGDEVTIVSSDGVGTWRVKDIAPIDPTEGSFQVSFALPDPEDEA